MKPLYKAISITALLLSTQLYAQASDNQRFGIAIHGGAGTINKAKMTPKKRKLYEQGLRQAVEAGDRKSTRLNSSH